MIPGEATMHIYQGTYDVTYSKDINIASPFSFEDYDEIELVIKASFIPLTESEEPEELLKLTKTNNDITVAGDNLSFNVYIPVDVTTKLKFSEAKYTINLLEYNDTKGIIVDPFLYGKVIVHD